MALKSGYVNLMRVVFIMVYLLFGASVGLPGLAVSGPAAQENASETDNTMLMFVGEELEVITAASRYPESPSAAPAVVQVVDHEEILAYGYATLADVLASTPGFYMADQGTGALPWLRGIPNGILVLYDGVPVPSGGNRTYSPLGPELSLDNVKRIEIIRGPGSVLWGTDAFAGIVNIVPFTGRDLEGSRVSFRTGSDHSLMAFANTGHRGKNWDAYLSVYGARDRYHRDKYLKADENGKWKGEYATIDDSEYVELTGNLSFNDVLFISGRFSDFSKSYTMEYTTDELNGFIWSSQREIPVNYIKANISKERGRSHWNFTTYYQNVAYRQEEAGSAVDESSGIYYGELIWDRRFFKKGLMTAGLSYRENHVHGALLGRGFMPAYVASEYQITRSPFKVGNYRNYLKSLFAQYRHQFVFGEIWFGCRLDDHSWYDDISASYSLGMNVPLTNNWRIKTNFGSAYRTPYSMQLVDSQDGANEEDNIGSTLGLLKREEVTTLNVQLEWVPDQDTLFSATSYYSRLSDHVEYDPLGLRSQLSVQDFAGVELYIRKKINDRLEGYAGVSKFFTFGDPFYFKFEGPTFIRPDGSTAPPEYEEWSQNYNAGADFVVNAGMLCHVTPWVTLSLTAVQTGSLPYSYEKNTISGSYNNPLLLNGELKLKRFPGSRYLPWENACLSIKCSNLLDHEFTYPGYYGAVEGAPLVFSLGFSCEF